MASVRPVDNWGLPNLDYDRRPRESSDDDRKAIRRWLDERIKPSLDYWRSFYGQVQEAFSYYEDDWCIAVDANGSIVRADQLDDTQYPRRSLNFLAVLADAIVARILSERPRPVAIAGRGGRGWDVNRVVQTVANMTINHVERLNQAEVEDQRLALYAALGGMAWVKSWFDPTLPGRVKLQDGRIVDHPTGDILYTALSALEVIPQPCAQVRFAKWFVHAYQRPLSWVRDEWRRGRDVQIDSGSATESSAAELAADPPSGLEKSSEPVDVYECYWSEADPATGAATWFRLIFAADTMLSRPSEIPELPLTPVYFNFAVRDCGATTLVWDLIPLQRELNQALSGWAFRRRLHQFPKPLLPRGMLDEADWDNSPEPYEVDVDQQGRLIAPQWMVPPQLDSQGVNEYIARIFTMMSERAGIHETSRGMTRLDIRSGRQAQIAAAQDNTNLQRPRQLFLEAKKAHWWKIIRIANAEFPPGKVLEVIGKDRVYESEVFLRDLLDDVASIAVESTSRIPLEINQRMDFVLNLAKMGLFQREQRPVLDELLRWLQFERTDDEEVDILRQARTQALKENESLFAGRLIPVGPYQVHEIHVEVHQQVTQLDSWQLIAPEVQRLVVDHIEAHKDAHADRAIDEGRRQLRVQTALQRAAMDAGGFAESQGQTKAQLRAGPNQPRLAPPQQQRPGGSQARQQPERPGAQATQGNDGQRQGTAPAPRTQ